MAASQNGSNRGGIIEGINVTPLVDITLVLLIIMMVTAKIIASPAVPLELPKAAKTEEVQVVFSVIVPANGPTLVDGKGAPDERSLLALARTALARDPALRAVIHADGAVPHRRVLETLDVLRQAGIAKVAFVALPKAAIAP
jgi:biopolymer transport protein ExbD